MVCGGVCGVEEGGGGRFGRGIYVGSSGLQGQLVLAEPPMEGSGTVEQRAIIR